MKDSPRGRLLGSVEELMDDRIRLFFSLLAGTGIFAVVGALFGALARALALQHGQAAGGPLGQMVTDAIRKVQEDLSPGAAAAISGGVEGACFLALIGGVVGAVAGFREEDQLAVLLYASLATIGLVSAATAFGVVAYGLLWIGVRVVAGVFLGGMSGALVGGWLDGTDGILIGTLSGALFGTFVCLLTIPWSQFGPRKPD
jgi:hypothetical protein